MKTTTGHIWRKTNWAYLKFFLRRRQGRKKTAGIPNPKRMFEEVSRFHLLFRCNIWSFSPVTIKRFAKHINLDKGMEWLHLLCKELPTNKKIYQANSPKCPHDRSSMKFWVAYTFTARTCRLKSRGIWSFSPSNQTNPAQCSMIDRQQISYFSHQTTIMYLMCNVWSNVSWLNVAQYVQHCCVLLEEMFGQNSNNLYLKIEPEYSRV